MGKYGLSPEDLRRRKAAKARQEVEGSLTYGVRKRVSGALKGS